MKAQSDLLKELTFQLTITKAMLKSVELDRILHIILSGLTHGDGLNFNRAVLFLVSQGRNELKIFRCAGPASGEEAHRIWEAILSMRLDLETIFDSYDAAQNLYFADELVHFLLRIDENEDMPELPASGEVGLEEVVRRVIATKQPFFSNALSVFCSEERGEDKLKFRHFACVPIMMSDRMLGVILVDNYFNSRLVSEDEMRGLTIVANLAAIAIERSRLYAQLSEMANIDGLTGVFNRRYYERHLCEVYAQTRLERGRLAMIVFDIDHFKRLNDTYGHTVGDAVLREFATLLKNNTRSEDMVARYGGEEFVILLRGTSEARHVLHIAEKLRAAVEAHAFDALSRGEVTVSAGAASIDYDESLALLFKRADEALYQSKNGGRNRVTFLSVAGFEESK